MARMTVLLVKTSYKRLSDAQEVAMATAAADTDTPKLPALLLLRSEDPPTLTDCISVIETRGYKHAASIEDMHHQKCHQYINIAITY